MSKEIRFLIIVPTYNSFEKLKILKKSLLSQTFQNWSVIFIDADSNFKHKEWLRSCVNLDKRFKSYKESKQIKGIFPSMTYGAGFAKKNDWVIFLGSDDWFYSNNSLFSIAKTIEENTEKIDQKLIICGTQFIHKNNIDVIRKNNVPKYRLISNKKLADLIFFGYVPAHQSLCFSHDLVEKLMPYSNKYHLAADADLIFKMLSLKEFKIVFINKILINIQAGGLSSKYLNKRLKEVLQIYINHFRFNFFIPFILRYLKKIFSRLKLINRLKNLI